jgi:hypothetical protein
MERSNIVKIEPNPLRKPSVKIKMETVSMTGKDVRYTQGADGTVKVQTKTKDVESIQRIPGTTVTFCAAITKNGLNTGLEDYVENPYVNEDGATNGFYRDGWEKILKGKKKIRRQELLEYKHNKPMGYYTNQVTNTIVNSHTPDDKLVFYQRPESKVNLNDGLTILDLDNPIHEVNYYMLKAHRNVAASYDEVTHNPEAHYYIVDELEKEKIKSTNSRKFNILGAKLEELMALPEGTIQDFCKGMMIKQRSMTKDESYSKLDEVCRANSNTYDEFMALYDLWKDIPTRDKFHAYAEMFDFLTTPGILTTRNNKYFWQQPANDGGKITPWEWSSREKFISFLLAPENSEEAEVMRMQYKAKSRQ